MAITAATHSPSTANGKTTRNFNVLPPSYYQRFLSRESLERKINPIRNLFPLERVPGVISLLAGKPNPTTFPIAGISLTVRDPRSAIKDKKSESDDSADLAEVKLDKATLEEGLQYAEEAGVRSLMNWFCGLQERVHGRRCTLYDEGGVDEAGEGWKMTIGVGSQDMIYKAIRAIVNPGEPVFLESPVYPGLPPILHSLHCEQIEIPTDDQGVSTAHLRNILESWPEGKPKPKIFYGVPTGCNPTGATASLERRIELLKLSREHDFLILEDDPYYYLYYGDSPRPPSYFGLEALVPVSEDGSSLPEVGRVIRLDSLSKVLSAGIRIGFASGPQPLLDALIKVTATVNLQTPTLTQIITYSLLTSPSWGYDGFQRHTEQIAEFYRRKRDVFEQYMTKYLGSGEDGGALAKWATPKAGLFFWFKILIDPDSESDGDSEALIQTKAFQNGVLALPGTVFLPSSQGTRKTGYVRSMEQFSFDLPPDHFLSLPRPESFQQQLVGAVDTTTLAAHDFDVDNRSGFMPPHPPVARLPSEWESWEQILDAAVEERLQLGEKPGLSISDREKSALWRARVRELPILPITELRSSEVILRRSHVVLAWIMHFYIHTIPADEPIAIPPPVTIPLLQICAHLQLPPVLTYSDDVLYNWALKRPSTALTPAFHNLRCQTLFTGLRDEEEFYLTSARIELRGVEALELMRATMDEAFVGDDIAIRRITGFLLRLAKVVGELKSLLLAVREGCDPEVFYNEIRPWFKGVDSDAANSRKWIFEGLDQDPSLSEPQELSGPSAGQSSLIHALDIFLGVEQYSHSATITGSSTSLDVEREEAKNRKQAFLNRMQLYMPRHHRNFLNHLRSNPRPLRDIVISSGDSKLLDAYNQSVAALKEFRDAHIIIVTLYIVGPARRAKVAKDQEGSRDPESLKGTGGTNLARFLKDVRDGTMDALI
uniref:Aminotransferase class I/classII large domain-containing protein n=1 Tax=Moniliophthora roreri TaxID=221103 RepID=A0A0W0EUN6_MONRR